MQAVRRLFSTLESKIIAKGTFGAGLDKRGLVTPRGSNALDLNVTASEFVDVHMYRKHRFRTVKLF